MADNRQMMIFDDGPIEVNGPLTLVDENGKTIAKVDDGETVYLCRCGASVDKPFCDGTHSKAGFTNGSKAFSRKA